MDRGSSFSVPGSGQTTSKNESKENSAQKIQTKASPNPSKPELKLRIKNKNAQITIQKFQLVTVDILPKAAGTAEHEQVTNRGTKNRNNLNTEQNYDCPEGKP